MKTADEAQHIALAMYQLPSGKAVDGANGHLTALSSARTSLTLLQEALVDSETPFLVDQSHLTLTFFDCMVSASSSPIC
jgi:hypothetical protein